MQWDVSNVYRIKVYGLVQGIGFRPFIKRLGNDMGLHGTVMNSDGVVTIHVNGNFNSVEELKRRIIDEAPKGALINDIKVEILTDNVIKKEMATTISNFIIINSDYERESIPPLIPVDLPVCDRCIDEMNNPNNRRYRYPFISCVSCGPRYSIIQDIPYDRENITMDSFKMCIKCENEYNDVDNLKRCYAQTISCHECGPYLKCYYTENGVRKCIQENEQCLEKINKVLVKGGIIAIKDIGGYHLACLANDKKAVENLRILKGREKKPFAVMFLDVESIEKYCTVNEYEDKALRSDQRPIVLLKKREDFKGDVCASSYETGAMLPCNPLQVLIVQDLKERYDNDCPLIMTSANKSGEPIIIRDEKMIRWYENEPLIDMVVSHDREILTPLDDSVMYVLNNGMRKMIRRSRGFVPEPVDISCSSNNCEIFASGGDLKSCFALIKDNKAYLSQYLGDMENEEVNTLYMETCKRMMRLLNIYPKLVVTDMHPLYKTTVNALKLTGSRGSSNIKTIAVQHHFAHAASVMAEIRAAENINSRANFEIRAVAAVFDGTGYGIDGNVWGGEFLLCEDTSDKHCILRADHIHRMKLTGGDEGARNGEIMLYGLFNQYVIEKKIDKNSVEYDKIKCVINRFGNYDKYEIVSKALSMGINAVKSTSAGRLFDMASTLLGICKYNDYEGECAMELENAAWKWLKIKEKSGGTERYDLGDYLHKTNESISIPEQVDDTFMIIDELIKYFDSSGKLMISKEHAAYKFHCMMAEFIINKCIKLADENNMNKVILSGGTFQNRMITEHVIHELSKKGIKTYTNNIVPSGDGGLALGQAYMVYRKIETGVS